MFEIGEPYTKAELAAAFAQLQAESQAYLEALPLAVFFAPQGNAWTPAAHVRHLTGPPQLVGQVIRIPKIVLRVAFSSAEAQSRDFTTVRAAYLAALARGAQAPALFTPSAKPPSVNLEASRMQLIGRLTEAVDRLIASVSSWDEGALDHYRLPHPFLGRLTIREMICFLLYHHAHHVRRVAERAGTLSVH